MSSSSPSSTSSASSLMQELKELQREHMSTIFARIEQVLTQSVGEETSLLDMTRYHMSTGGKRLRALLPLVVARCFDVPADRLVSFGAACEMLHNATLVHDDLQDGDRVRRGEPTIWVEYGMPQAINLGDAMLYVTILLLDELDVSAEARQRAIRRLATETLRVVDGQEREFALQSMPWPGREQYFRMVEGKTSGLFALPVVGAAELCGAEQALLDALQEAARHLGVIFQIQDDILDLYGEKGREAPGSDVAEGKISMLVIHALEMAEREDAEWLRALLQREREQVTREDIDRAMTLFKTCGALGASFAEIDRRASAALEQPALKANPALSDVVREMVDVFLAPIKDVRQQ